MNNMIWIKTPQNNDQDFSSRFTMVEFKKEITLSSKAVLKIYADTKYELYINNELIGRGPASAGGDFNLNKTTEGLKYAFYDKYILNKKGTIEIKAIVTSIPTCLNEYTFGQPALWVEVSEGEKIIGHTDESWNCRILKERTAPGWSDYSIAREKAKATFVKTIQKLKPSPLKHLVSEKIIPTNFSPLSIAPHECVKAKYLLPKIYSGYIHLSIKCKDSVYVRILTEELDGKSIKSEEILTNKSTIHISQRMFSIGQLSIEFHNNGNHLCEIRDLHVEYVSYPVNNKAYFDCSDNSLTKLFDVCLHTLQICRHNTHLDSPYHQEPLACTGDYLIESLMEYLNIYDPTLTAFDIYRTAERLKYSKGFMFHTSYSLMFPMWLLDYYNHTGDKKLIKKTSEAIDSLLSLFQSYTSKKNNLIETAPNYMFVDWIAMQNKKNPFSDANDIMNHDKFKGFSLHHPPKFLGQTVLCMFYYQALISSSKLYEAIGENDKASSLNKQALTLKKAINKLLFDKDRKLYIGGLPTKDEIENTEWLPKNIKRTFHLKQANILAVLFDIAPQKYHKNILQYVMHNLRKEEMQPYFYHFLFEALYKENLFDKYGFSILEKYNELIEKTDKGLCEAWDFANGDYSHAWGGSPAYILKKAFSGISITDPTFKHISLKPNLFHLKHAFFNISTPYGNIDIRLEEGKKPIIKAPKQIKITLK